MCRSGAHHLVLVGGAKKPLEERKYVGVGCDGRRLDETSSSGVVRKAVEPGCDGRHDRSVGGGPALDRELRKRGGMASCRDRTDHGVDAGRRGGAVGESPHCLLSEEEIVVAGECLQRRVELGAREPGQRPECEAMCETIARIDEGPQESSVGCPSGGEEQRGVRAKRR